MNYYIQDENKKIVFYDTNLEVVKNTLLVRPQYQGLEILETEREIIELNNEFVFKDEVEDELKLKRKEDFESKFLTTSLGNYRLTPKGYANAQQGIDTINNIVNALGGLTEQIAKKVLFYETPDFTKEEQCTEEWLIEHQYSANPMSKEEWINFYIEFSTLYAEKQYQS